MSGLKSDRDTLSEILAELNQIIVEDVQSVSAKVILNLVAARNHNLTTASQQIEQAGVMRDEYLDKAMTFAQESDNLQMMVYAEKALLYAEEGLNIKTREPRQQACADSVEFACKIGDPFAEALGCDVRATTVWHTDLVVRLEWIERGLVGAKALNADVALALDYSINGVESIWHRED